MGFAPKLVLIRRNEQWGSSIDYVFFHCFIRLVIFDVKGMKIVLKVIIAEKIRPGEPGRKMNFNEHS
jgi:hypothetical protein